MKALPVSLAVLSLAFAGIALSTTYRWVDADGVVHYSDTPQPGATVVELTPTQTYHATPVPAQSQASATAGNSEVAVYNSCAITQPKAEDTLYAPQSVDVTVQIVPDLRDGDALTVTMDGAPLQSSDSALQFRSTNVDRGTHVLNSTIRDASGKQLCAANVTFYIRQPSLGSPQSPARGH